MTREQIETFAPTTKFGPSQETRSFEGWGWDLLVRSDADGRTSVHLEHESGAYVPPGPNYRSHPVPEMDRLRQLVRDGGL